MCLRNENGVVMFRYPTYGRTQHFSPGWGLGTGTLSSDKRDSRRTRLSSVSAAQAIAYEPFLKMKPKNDRLSTFLLAPTYRSSERFVSAAMNIAYASCIQFTFSFTGGAWAHVLHMASHSSKSKLKLNLNRGIFDALSLAGDESVL